LQAAYSIHQSQRKDFSDQTSAEMIFYIPESHWKRQSLARIDQKLQLFLFTCHKQGVRKIEL